MLKCLVLTNYQILEGVSRGTIVGKITNRDQNASLLMIDDAGGRFELVGDYVVAGPVATDCSLATGHTIILEERHNHNGTSLQTYCFMTVLAAYQLQAPPPPVFHQGGVIPAGQIQSGTINTGTIQAAPPPPALQPDPPKSLSQLMGDEIKKMADLFVGESVKTFKPEGVVIPKTRIALYSKQHADMIPECVRKVRIAGEGEKLATMICLPDERYDYQAGWSDCVTVGLVVEGGTP